MGRVLSLSQASLIISPMGSPHHHPPTYWSLFHLGICIPFFQELVSLTLVGLNFVRANGAALITLFGMLGWRQASPFTLDRIELHVCTVNSEEEDGNSLRLFASVAMWDSIFNALSWTNEQQMDHVDKERDDDDDDDDDDEAEAE